MYRSHVLVCGGTGCTSSHSAEIIAEFEKEIAEKGLADEIKVIRTGCFGLCALGPIVVVYPEGAFYSQIKVEDVSEIVDEHLIKGRIVKHLLYDDTVAGDTAPPPGPRTLVEYVHGIGPAAADAANPAKTVKVARRANMQDSSPKNTAGEGSGAGGRGSTPTARPSSAPAAMARSTTCPSWSASRPVRAPGPSGTAVRSINGAQTNFKE